MAQTRSRYSFWTILCPLLLVVFVFPGLARAEYKSQAKELFWIDVPEGWTWSENGSTVLLMNPTGSEQATINFREMPDVVGDVTEFVTNARDDKRREMAGRGAKSVMKEERKIDGAYAWQVGFLVPVSDGVDQATSIVFLHEKYFFDIYLEARYEFQRLEIEKVIDTLRFKKPEPEKKEPSTGNEEKPDWSVKTPQAHEIEPPIANQAASE